MTAQLQKELGDDLFRACTSGDLATVRSTLQTTQSANPSYNPPLTAIMQAAATQDRADIVSYCLQHGGTITDPVMSTLICSNAFTTHKLLVESNAIPISYYIPWFGTVLAVVAEEGNYAWTKFCLEHGAEPDKDRREEYKTVLAATAESGHVDVVRLLLEHGATLRGSGAIVLAAEAGKKEMVEFLLGKGADVDEMGVEHPTDPRETEEMGSALHKAAEAGHREVVELLLESGADVNLKDVQGRTPLARARESNREGIVRLLESRGAE